jgi:hypothetical protein
MDRATAKVKNSRKMKLRVAQAWAEATDIW